MDRRRSIRALADRFVTGCRAIARRGLLDRRRGERDAAASSLRIQAIGVVFDPEELTARYEAGEPLATLTVRPPLPEGTGPFDMLRF